MYKDEFFFSILRVSFVFTKSNDSGYFSFLVPFESVIRYSHGRTDIYLLFFPFSFVPLHVR